MNRKELEHQLPLTQNSLEAIEAELEELITLRDTNLIRLAAIDGEARYFAASLRCRV
jgi:hypothetical protein